MILGSVRSRKRLGEISIAALLVLMVWLIQLALLSKFRFGDVLCNLPLTMIIVWGVTFGSPMPKPTNDELRVSTLPAILVRQLLSGSPSGAIIGAFFAALASSVIPAYPFAYPIIGWTAGYFSLKNFNQAAFLCIPLVLLLSFLGEILMAVQLSLMGRHEVFSHLVMISFPEALLNALIAPVLFFPMRGWFEFSRWRHMSTE
jgi:rod shape-determining protein MreD